MQQPLFQLPPLLLTTKEGVRFGYIAQFQRGRQGERLTRSLVQGEELLCELAAQIAPEENGGNRIQAGIGRVLAAQIDTMWSRKRIWR
ncbi:MAG: hypothetical protein R3A44_00095 [Caldilineaceae bacterium]